MSQICEKKKYLLAPPYCETVETFISPIPSSSLEASNGLKIGGGWAYFKKLKVLQKKNNSYVEVEMSPSRLLKSAKIYSKKCHKKAELHLENIIKKRHKFSRLDMTKPHIMGIVNLTPDSFYKNSQINHYDLINKIYLKMKKNGASIIDFGGESTRPGAKRISINEEKKRVLSSIQSIKHENRNSLISVDTRNLSTMRTCYENGVDIINDITGFNNKEKVNFISTNKIPVIVMHMQKKPENMQIDPKYSFAPVDIYKFFSKKINYLLKMGVDLSNIVIDPGIGFGKNMYHNLDILKNLTIFHSLGVPILIGVSRKSLIGELTIEDYKSRGINKKSVNPTKRLSGSIAFAMHANKSGVQIIRTHDVFETKQALICQNAMSRRF